MTKDVGVLGALFMGGYQEKHSDKFQGYGCYVDLSALKKVSRD